MQLKEKMRVSASIIKEFVMFNKRAAFFAVNNTCNSKCKMCSIWKNKVKKNVSYEDAVKVLDKLKENNFRIVQITGGEPFLNPDIFKILGYAKKLGLFVLVVTNGSLITRKAAKQLAAINVDQVSVSFHHCDPEVFEKIENHKNIFEKASKAIEYLKEENVHVSTLCTISKYNMNDIERTISFLEDKGMYTSFCIPVTLDQTSFSLGGDSCVNLNKNELKGIVSEIIEMKERGYKIINSSVYLRDVIDSLEGRSKYPCYGGSKIWFVDWDLKVYPCMGKGIGKSIDEATFEDHDVCKECLIQCFREPSVFFKSRKDALKAFSKDIKFYLKGF